MVRYLRREAFVCHLTCDRGETQPPNAVAETRFVDQRIAFRLAASISIERVVQGDQPLDRGASVMMSSPSTPQA